MDSFDNTELALKYIWDTYLGKWYIWGGDNPKGFDCSGLAVEYLKSCGVVSRGSDYTAASLYKKFVSYQSPLPTRGCLVFFRKNKKINHVEIAVNSRLSIGARGGGNKIITVADAIKHDAFIKLRPFHNRKPFAYINVKIIK